ncbi:MAG: hypothetical protein ACRC3J_05310 [Culicoidibacterales bacterium]
MNYPDSLLYTPDEFHAKILSNVCEEYGISMEECKECYDIARSEHDQIWVNGITQAVLKSRVIPLFVMDCLEEIRPTYGVELCNKYDAKVNGVHVYIPPRIRNKNAYL